MRRNRLTAKGREHCNEKNLENTERNKQHEVKNSKEQASIAKKDRNRKKWGAERVLEDGKKNKKSKWWETTRKCMNWAQIEEQEIKEKTATEIKGSVAKVVEEEWKDDYWRRKTP